MKISLLRHSGRDCQTNPSGTDLHLPVGRNTWMYFVNPEYREVFGYSTIPGFWIATSPAAMTSYLIFYCIRFK